MEIIVSAETDIRLVARAAAETQGIETSSLTVGRWLRWLRSEHSMIRLYQISIRLVGIPSYVSVHLVRHKIGVEHFVRSQRDTSMNPVDYDRRKAPQDALVNHRMVLNPQSLINISQVRLCNKADQATRNVWYNVLLVIWGHENPYISAISEVMMPRCEYRGGVCHELRPCGKYPHYKCGTKMTRA